MRPYADDELNGVRSEVVRLYLAGHDYTFIAAAVGLPKHRVGKLLKEVYQEQFGDRQGMIERLVGQYDRVARLVMEQVESSRGRDHKAVEAFLKTTAEMRKLRGLDQPSQVNVNHTYEDWSIEDVNAALAQYGVRPLPQLPAPPEDPAGVPDAEFRVASEAVRVKLTDAGEVPFRPTAERPDEPQ